VGDPVLSPDEELAALRRRRRNGRIRAVCAVAVLAAVCAGVAWLRRPRPEPPERTLFASALPHWSVERLNGREGGAERRAMLDGAAPWPGLREALEKLADSYDRERPVLLESVAAVNAAARAAGLAYWVDAPHAAGKQWILSYDVLARSRWTLDGGKSVEVLRVRRLDRVNLEMAFLGHAGGDQPVVLLDRVEAELLDLAHGAYARDGRGGVAEQAANGAWRSVMQNLAGAAALAEGARLLEERAERVRRLAKGPKGGVIVEFPDRVELGDEFLDSLMPYADVARGGGPVLLGADLRAVREADRALRTGEPRRALDAVLDQMASDTEAHEARHALEPLGDGPVPALVLEAAGDDDERFARSAANELTAYLGQLHASARPCAVLAQLAFRAKGDRARATPHHFAAHVLLHALSYAPEKPLTAGQLEEDLLQSCREPPETLRARTAAAHEKILGTPFAAATRAEVAAR